MLLTHPAIMLKRPIKGPALSLSDFDTLTYPVLALPKVDGFRCIITSSGPKTSRLSAFPNAYFCRALSDLIPPHIILDSEVTVGSLQQTSSALTSHDTTNFDFTVHVFDSVTNLSTPYDQRYKNARAIVRRLNYPRIKLLPLHVIESSHSLSDYLSEQLDRGYEGIIIRSPHGIYKEGKSTLREQYLLKVKPFTDSEGTVIGYFEEEYNGNEIVTHNDGKNRRRSCKANKLGKNSLGGLLLRDIHSGVEVRVGGGFTAEQRVSLWLLQDKLLGRIVKYKYQQVGMKDKPRHPSFIDFRPEFDCG